MNPCMRSGTKILHDLLGLRSEPTQNSSLSQTNASLPDESEAGRNSSTFITNHSVNELEEKEDEYKK